MREAPRLHDVAIQTGLTGAGATLIRPQRLSTEAAWRLLRTPSSEAGIQAYYRALLGRPPEPTALLETMQALQLGRATRIDVIGSIAASPEARSKGLHGEGLLLIRLVRLAFNFSGLRRNTLRKRMALPVMEPLGAPTGAAPAPQDNSAELMRRLVTLEGRLVRQERRLAGLLRSQVEHGDLDGLKDRVATLEATLLDMLNAEAERLRDEAAVDEPRREYRTGDLL
jgi:hypothetical protein